jgi:hypothetical protein
MNTATTAANQTANLRPAVNSYNPNASRIIFESLYRHSTRFNIRDPNEVLLNEFEPQSEEQENMRRE